ncbi:MAG: hypothetical protein GY869_26680, partial [Planctomycetes bacterium]|nr:hypothetical protein [Planctomycetota bacterium]
MSTTINFFTALFGMQPQGRILVWTLPDKRSTWFTDPSAAEENALGLPDGTDVYFGVGLAPENYGPHVRCKAEDVIGIGALWMDVDFGDGHNKQVPPDEATAREILDKVKIPPSIIVHSGGGYHAYWLLERPWIFNDDADRSRAQALVRGWQENIRSIFEAQGYTLDVTSDLARLLRVPGTNNCKNNEIRPVNIIYPTENINGQLRRYSIEDFDINSAEPAKFFAISLESKTVGSANQTGGLKTQKKKKSAGDEELLTKARDAGNGDKFMALFDRGDVSAYTSDSEADLALCGMLAFWTRRDPERIDQLFRQSALCRKKWIERGDYRERTITKALGRGSDFYSQDPTAAKESSVAAARNDRPWALTDLGNAERLAFYYGRKIRYCGPLGKWLIWSGKHWEPDKTGRIYRMAFKTVKRLWDEVKAANNAGVQDDISKWARMSQSRTRIDNLIHLCRSLPDIAVSSEALDKHSFFLNCSNGTLDLKSGKLLRPDPNHLITKIIPVAYKQNASCPLWTQFLTRIMNGNEMLIGYLQRLVGLCLTGDVSEQILFIFYGEGANGKSVFLDTISSILGEYASESAPDLLVAKRNAEHPTEIADLQGRRLVVTSETEQGSALKVQLVKRLTGNAKLKGRFMRQDYFEFDRTHKLILCTNNRPVIREDSNAIWRRLRLI